VLRGKHRATACTGTNERRWDVEMCENAPETRCFRVQGGDGAGALVSYNNDARLENGSNDE